jgi:hypothetical protein
MGWFDSFFSGLSDLVGGASPSVGDAMMGGTTDLGALAASTPSFAADPSSWLGDTASSGFSSLGGLFDSGARGGVDFGGMDSMNPATFGGGGGGATPFFDPNTVGQPPVGSALPPAAPPTVGEGAATVGAFPSQRPGAEDVAEAVDPEAFARQGQSVNSWNPATGSPVGSTVQAPPPPTAWESIQQTPGKWWQGAQDFPGKMAASFNRDPFGNSLKLATTGASIGVPLAAALMQPKPPRALSSTQTGSMSPLIAAGQPLPGTTGTGRADLPAGSPMSGLLTNRGGFNVDPNVGLKKKVND